MLITGASEGIGAACAEACRKRGARLALSARNETKLNQVAGVDGLAIPGDLTQPETRRLIVERTVAHYGTIDVLINNAGAGLYVAAHLAPMEQARQLFELNFFAMLEMSQLAAAVMRKQESGSIVNVSSIAGKLTLPWFTLYSASKHAVCALTDGLRMELKRDGIHAITVCPGYVDTGFQSHVIAGRPPLVMQRSRPLRITAERCAEAIVRGIERNARTVVTPVSGWLLMAAARMFPSLVDWQLERMYSKAR